MKKAISFFVVFILFSSTCKKAMQVPDPELEKIFGKWGWVESSGGFAGQTITPKSENYKVRLQFGSNGIYTKYKNSDLIERKKFTFLPSKSLRGLEDVWTLAFIELQAPFNVNPFAMAVSFSGQDTLLLEEQVHDGYGHVYVRIK